MPYYTPSIRAIECSTKIPDKAPDRVSDDAPSLVCGSCGDTMRLFRTIPSLGMRQQQLMFVCPSCKEVDTRVRRI
jgi:predicted RNA-binding Zn-ribbon protein involved in translation (DUF1610 family)